MTGTELLKYQLNDCTHQLRQVLEGMSEEIMDTPLVEGGMSPRQTLEHLCECYQALLTSAEGKNHNWGTYKAADTATDALKKTMWDMRDKALATHDDSEQSFHRIHMYLLGHDYYHIGQLCLLRTTREPDWDLYSIYQH